MSREPTVRGGIIAAGEGSRLRQAGWRMPKPLVPVAGTPLIERVIRNFLAAEISSVVIIVNERDRECEHWIESRFPNLDLHVIVKTTNSSLESFLEVARHLGSGRSLISTVDAWCPEETFLAFVNAALELPEEAIILAVTPFVEDERPLWVSMDASGRITQLGGDSGEMVTAGMYLVPERVRHRPPPPEVESLRAFLGWLLDRGEPMYGVILPVVVDVDRAEDIVVAESLAHHKSQVGQDRSRGAS